MKAIFMGTPEIAATILKSVLGSKHEILAVVTQPDKPKGRSQTTLTFPPVKEVALEHNIPVFQPQKVKEEGFLEEVKKLNPDIILVAAYGKLLPKVLLDMPRFGCINVHASLLPKYRGASPIQWAVLNGEEKRIVQLLINSKLKNNEYPIQKTEISINSLNTIEQCTVFAKKTDSTNVNSIFNSDSYRYDELNKTLIVTVLNEDTENISWQKNATDSFVITYILDKNEDITNLISNINTKVTLYDKKELSVDNKIVLNEEVKKIISNDIELKEKEIFKGKLYTGEEREYETEGRLHLDKDIKYPGNTVYSPQTCILTPQKINMLFMNKPNKRGLPNGIIERPNGYLARYNGKDYGVHKTLNEAYLRYATEKGKAIKSIADEYKDIIPQNVYEVLLNYKVDIRNDKNYVV